MDIDDIIKKSKGHPGEHFCTFRSTFNLRTYGVRRNGLPRFRGEFKTDIEKKICTFIDTVLREVFFFF